MDSSEDTDKTYGIHGNVARIRLSRPDCKTHADHQLVLEIYQTLDSVDGLFFSYEEEFISRVSHMKMNIVRAAHSKYSRSHCIERDTISFRRPRAGWQRPEWDGKWLSIA